MRGFSKFSGVAVLSLRRQLKDLIKSETFGCVSVCQSSFKLDLKDELSVCFSKITDLSDYVKSQVFFVVHSHEARHIDTKLRHLFARVGSFM